MLPQIICSAVIGLSLFPRSATICKHAKTVVQASEENNLEPTLLIALIGVESNWKSTAVSKARACGLTQVMEKYSKHTCKQLTNNPKLSIKEGAKKLSFWLYKYGKGNIKVGLCGYNAGFRCKGKNPNKQGMSYARKVLKYKKQLDEAIEKKKNEEAKNEQGCDRIFLRVGSFCF